MTSLIVVVVSPQGEITLETQGFTGPQCREVSHQLEAALGLVTRDTPTAAFYANAREDARLRTQE